MTDALWRALALLAYLLLGGFALLVPALVGLLAGSMLGQHPTGLVLAMAASAAAAFLWARLTLTALWWVKAGEWNWQRTGLRRAFAHRRHLRLALANRTPMGEPWKHQ